jgi:hypothetical protein
MAISITLFKSLYDNKTNKRMDFENWEQFSKLLFTLAKQPLKDKKDAQLISPAVYQHETTRANKNVLAWAGWAAIDVDDHEFKGNLENELRDRFGHWTYVCYSTASSTDDFPKFRIVFPLKSPVKQEDIKHFWYALNTHIGSMGDKQTKDLSRMYYIPATYLGANNFIFSNDGGEFVDPTSLMAKYEFAQKSGKNFIDRLPEALQKQVMEHRKSKLDNTGIVWTSYRDCPFWPKKLASEYQVISNTGWYHKMYQIMVAIAARAVERQYPINSNEITNLCREFDMETGNWYENRPMDVEADRALEYVYKNV